MTSSSLRVARQIAAAPDWRLARLRRKALSQDRELFFKSMDVPAEDLCVDSGATEARNFVEEAAIVLQDFGVHGNPLLDISGRGENRLVPYQDPNLVLRPLRHAEEDQLRAVIAAVIDGAGTGSSRRSSAESSPCNCLLQNARPSSSR